nr:hypothetical protein [Tanacetum cinerariifolium]
MGGPAIATGSDNSRDSIGAKGSFASLLKKPITSKVVRLSMMKNVESVTGANVSIPLPAVEEVSKRNPIMLDAYTSLMCQKSWGKNSYARALVEVSSLNPLQDSLVVAMPFPDGSGHSLESIEVDYEWTPPRCETRKIFDHVDDPCPKRVKVVVQIQVEDDGFTKVNNKKKQQSTNQQGSNRQVAGMKLTKPKLNLVYKVVNKQVTDEGTSSQPAKHQSKLSPKHAEKENLLSLSNSFETLNKFEDGPPIKKVYGSTDVENLLSNDEEDIENMNDETILNSSAKYVSKGASNPSQEGSRIIMGWNPYILNVVVIASDDQIMHTHVALWKNLKTHKGYVRGRPWVVLGDFNVSLPADEKSTGSSYIDTGMQIKNPYRTSNHALAVLRIPMNSMKRPHAFKFFNLLVHNTRFKEVVFNVCQQTISGFWMFKVARRLKLLKKPLRKLLFDHGNIHENVKKLRHELDEAQKALDSYPSNVELREEEVVYLHAYQDAILMEERLLVQKAKIDWLKLGDANTAYFHKVVKSQTARNRIDSIVHNNGATIDGDQVPLAFIDYYTEILGQPGTATVFHSNDIFCNRLSMEGANSMIREISDKEIKDTMFSMDDNKAPSPDGFSTVFFKEAWDIIGVDVCKAIKEFFTNGILLKELNHTIIALIPKVNSPVRINDYRAISCCNTLYKCISKILANRMKESLSELISLNQSAFVSGRRIADNILLTQELMHNYHLDRGLARCAFKDGLWNVSRPHRSLLALIDALMVSLKVRELNIINLCFTDNLFLFAHGDENSARVIMDSLEEFKNASGLTPSLPKSTAYFCNVLNYVKIRILSILPFEEGTLPVKHLGVPLVPSRTQLIRSVLESMHVYWASVFILPSSLMHDLEQVIRGFLWCQGEMKRAGLGRDARVSDIVLADSWVWPSGWLVKYPPLANIVVSNLTNAADCYTWLNHQNMEVGYSVAAVWECIRPRNNEIDWFNPDTHEHLFFECRFSFQVWECVKSLTSITGIPSTLNSIVDFSIPLAHRKSARSVTLKLVFAATCYFLWQERNNRLFKKTKRTQD